MCVTFPARSEICEHVANVPGTLEIRHQVPSKLHQSYARAMRIDEFAWRTAVYSHKYLLHVKIICKYRRAFRFRGRGRARFIPTQTCETSKVVLRSSDVQIGTEHRKLLQSQSAVIYRNSKLHEIETGSRQCSDGNVADYKYGRLRAMKKNPVKYEVIFIFTEIYICSNII